MPKPDPKKTVIEYEFKGYSPPTDLEAWAVSASVTHTDTPQAFAHNLAEIREELEELNASLDGAHQLQRQNRGRYSPRWREVWSVLQ